ncbi:MAG: amino acid ABC transporter substrate-binding protein [Oscillochloris sp.]|nr:amino acid ABC transporter substrate-binding protein [Oscillochloris sp.]
MSKTASHKTTRFARRFLDLSAILILAGYLWVVWSASGTAPAGPALDPIWQAIQERGTLRVAVDLGFRPFTNLRNGEPVGYDIDLAQAVAAELGVEAEFVAVGFDGLYDSLTSGRVDLIASALPYAPEQGYRARFSAVYFDAGLMLVAPAGSSLKGSDDLRNHVVGAALGSDADALLRRLAVDQPALDIRNQFDTPEAVLDALRADQLDAAIVDRITALSTQNRTPNLQIVEALSYDPYVLALPAAAFQFHAEVNAALDTLRAEGFFEELNARWMR